MAYAALSAKIYDWLCRDIPVLSDYARVLFHPTNFTSFLPYLHARMNGNYQTYSLKLDEIDWETYVYPELRKYAQNANPDEKLRPRPLLTLEEAQHDLLDSLGDFFVHDAIGSQHRLNNFLRDQAGDWAYKASMRIAPHVQMERPMEETTRGGKLSAQDELDQAISNYFVGETPYANAMTKAQEVEKYTNDYFNQGWGV